MNTTSYCADCFYLGGRHHPHCPAAEDDDAPPPPEWGDEIDHAWDQFRAGLKDS